MTYILKDNVKLYYKIYKLKNYKGIHIFSYIEERDMFGFPVEYIYLRYYASNLRYIDFLMFHSGMVCEV